MNGHFIKNILKSFAAVMLLAVMIACLSSCGADHKMTLMIYMIGSDLESKSGMGTEDLQEITDSGVDLSDVNIVVCAGGTEKWRNDEMSAEKISIMHLEKGGFTVDEEWESASMGESGTLTQFVDYCAKNYENESYALIMWDHGNGPVMGYGMDTLYNRDSLTLPEMKDAMEASVFGKDKKLSWVGFDACLMASAELACIWSDYADYLIASQEVEPSFGWQYSFLKKADKLETPDLIKYIAETYMGACDEYYKEKGYDERDTTISCMDLSKTGELEKAVNALFGKAADDVKDSYNQLAARRIKTRALGRATTGSEYDLVDLNDAAEQLSKYYPEEAKAVQDAVGELIIANETNSDLLSGASLYYPFFNKYYYESSWEDAYNELGIFPEYNRYLAGYDKTWLGEDKLNTASDALPALVEEGKYSLKLTTEQAETFAEARMHVMVHHYGDAYMPVFTSPNVTFDERDQTLTADYDGKALYAVNDLNEYTIPISNLISSENGISHYAVNCTVYKYSPNDIWDMTPQEQEENSEEYNSYTRAWYNLAVNEEDGTVRTSSMLGRGEEDVGIDNLQTGKAEELTEDDWDYYLFDLDSPHVLTRNDDGTILPLDEWHTLQGFSYLEMTKKNGLEFVYAPLEKGDYSIMFEITDTQGNKYCSEPAPIDSESTVFRETEPKEVNEVNWESGDRKKLLEKDGLTLYLRNMEYDGEPIQTFELTNNTEEEVIFELSGPGAVANGNIDQSNLHFSVRAKPGETSTTSSTVYDEEPNQSRLEFGMAEEYGILEKVDTLEFYASVQSMDTHRKIWVDEPFKVTYSEETAPPLKSDPYGLYEDMESVSELCSDPYLGASAEEQILYEDDDVEVKLTGLGANEYGDSGFVIFTNKSDKIQYISFDGAVYNGRFGYLIDQVQIMPHTVRYDYLPWISYDCEALGVEGISDLKFALRKCPNENLGSMGFGDITWCPVKLKTKASETGSFSAGEKTLYEKDGLRLALVRYVPPNTESWAVPSWVLSLENDTDKDISLDMTDVDMNGKHAGNDRNKWNAYMDSNPIGAHQKRYFSVIGNTESLKTISFKLLIKSYTGDRILETADDVITLSTE